MIYYYNLSNIYAILQGNKGCTQGRRFRFWLGGGGGEGGKIKTIVAESDAATAGGAARRWFSAEGWGFGGGVSPHPRKFLMI